MPIRPLAVTMLLAAFASLVLATAGSAQEGLPTARALLVLDGSAAMAEPFAETKKGPAARQALSAALLGQTSPLDLGLLAYGHRRRSGCTDIEVLRPVGRLNARRLARSIGAVRPRGQASLSAALTSAAQALKPGEERAGILVVAGAADACQGDPCATAKELATTHPGLSIDVIGVGLATADEPRVSCIAANARGRYFAASDQAGLQAAATEALALLVERAAEPVAPPAPLPPELRLSVRLGPSGGSFAGPLQWTVGRAGKTVYSGTDAAPVLAVEAGTYDVEVKAGPIRTVTQVQVAAEGPTEKAVELEAGIIHLLAVGGGPGEDLSNIYFTLYRLGGAGEAPAATVAVSRNPPPAFLLPPGNYLVRIERGLLRSERSIALDAGREVTEEFPIQLGTLALSALSQATGAPAEDVTFEVSEDDPAAPGGQREVVRSASPAPVFALPPGLYHVEARQGLSRVRADFAVRAAETTQAQLQLEAASLALATKLPAPADPAEDLVTYVVARVDETSGQASEVLRTARAEPQLVLEPGQYRVTARLGAANAVAFADVAVKPGRLTSMVLQPVAGVVELRLDGTAVPGQSVLWEIQDEARRPIWTTARPAPRVPLAPGTYHARVVYRGLERTVGFTLIGDERKVIEIPTQ